MCRYSDPRYRTHYACLDCRKSFAHYNRYGAGCLCPECRQPMKNMGMDFQPPKRKNKRAWRVIAELVERGRRFHSCGCEGPGYRPRQMWGVKVYDRDVKRYSNHPSRRKAAMWSGRRWWRRV